MINPYRIASLHAPAQPLTFQAQSLYLLMLPTIDISLIGVLLAVWTGLKTIWGWLSGALNWITQRALAAIIDSKFWATAAFLAAVVGIFSLIQAIVDIALTALGQWVGASISSLDSGVRDILGLLVPFSDIGDVLSTFITCFGTYFAIVNISLARRMLMQAFVAMSRAWKA